MPRRSFGRQLRRDVWLSPLKPLCLAAMFGFGAYLWLPSLYSALKDRPETSIHSETPPLSIHAPTITAETSFAAKPTTSLEKSAIPTVDPLVRSAEAAAIQSDPLQIDPSRIPAPILFADEKKSDTPSTPKSNGPRAPTSHGLTLRSTIVGVSRRAADINRRLYVEGATIEENGVSYQLLAVYPGRVLLRHVDRVIELTVSDAAATNVPLGSTLVR